VEEIIPGIAPISIYPKTIENSGSRGSTCKTLALRKVQYEQRPAPIGAGEILGNTDSVWKPRKSYHMCICNIYGKGQQVTRYLSLDFLINLIKLLSLIYTRSKVHQEVEIEDGLIYDTKLKTLRPATTEVKI